MKSVRSIKTLALGIAGLLWLSLGQSATGRQERAGLIFDGVPDPDPAVTEKLARYQQGRGMRLLDWMADGSLLVAMRDDQTEQLQRIRTPLAAPEPLAASDDVLISAAAQHFKSDVILALRQNQYRVAAVQRIDLATRNAQPLLDPSWHPVAPLWSHDDQRIAFGAAQVGANHAIYLMTAAPAGQAESPRWLAGGNGDWQVRDWSLNDRQLLLQQRDLQGDNLLQVLDIGAGTLRTVASVDADSEISGGVFSPDTRGVLYLSNLNGEFTSLRYTNLSDASTRTLTPDLGRDVESFAISANGRYLAYSYDDNSWSRVVVIDQVSHLERVVAALPAGVVTALKFDLGGSNLAINVEDSVTPPNVYVLDVTTQALTRWTRAEAGPVDVAQLSVAAPMRFRSWDHSEGLPRQLTGLILRPAKTPAPTPVLIWLPGDERQPRPRFDAQLQSIVNTGGYTVIMPGLRGSGGRGRGFAALAEGDRREHAVRDVGALLAWIAAQPGIDGSRIAIAGVGTSADIAQMSAVRFNERIHAAVLIDGMPGRIQPNALSGPLLIVRGFDNPPLASPLADQLLWRMRTAGVDSWLLSARDGTELWPGADRGAELARVITQFLAQSLTQSQARSRTPALN